MSYLVFARKYRPRNFDEIVGQEHVTKSLKSAVSSDKLAHAYIFSGPRGVGKTSCARILAKSLNCKDAPTVKPCGKCPACVEISEGRSLDVIEIDGASNRGIDDIRNLRENVRFGSTCGKYKVYIIDEVHQITVDGFNALLKTLEEPPPHVKFIFATTALHKVLPTIRSRCQRFEFRPIPALQIMAKLEDIAGKEGLAVEKNALFAIARASEGSLRDAESILDQISSFSGGKITLKDVISVLGMIEESLLVSLVDKIIQKDPSGALDIADNIITQGRDTSVFVVSLIEYFRDLMIVKTAYVRLDKLLDVPMQMREKMMEQSKGISLSEILNNINILIDTQEMLKRVDSRRIPMEVAIIRLTGGFRESSKEPNLSQPETNPSIPAQPKLSQPETSSSISASSHSEPQDGAQRINMQERPLVKEAQGHFKKVVALEHISQIWQATIEKISKVRMSIATYLNEGNPLKVENNVLFISFPKKFKFHKDVLARRENIEFIEQNLSKALDARLKLSFILSDEPVVENELEIEPSIKSTIESFKGKIVKRSF